MPAKNNQPFFKVLLLCTVMFGVLAAIFAGVIALTSSASFLGVFGGIMAFVVVIMVPTFLWLYVIEPPLVRMMRPHIYVIEDGALFLYSKGNQRVLFNYLTILTDEVNGGLFGGINNLYISKYRKLDESNSYLVFDKNNELVAILPYKKRYSDDKKDIILVRSHDNKEFMGLYEFINNQDNIMLDSKRKK